MKTLKLTKDELVVLQNCLFIHPCTKGCLIEPTPKFNCYTTDKSGKIKCPIQRACDSLYLKLYGGDE